MKSAPTTLRYIKVASDLHDLFGDNLGDHVVEIGCGYGGQMLILDQLFEIPRYTMFDVPLVCQLISKFIESFAINGSYLVTTLNKYQASKVDLVISNYVFSELPKHLQLIYVRKVLSGASKSYLTMNSGKGGSLDVIFEILTLEELGEVLPEFEVIDEVPLTAPFNYAIAWNHKPQ